MKVKRAQTLNLFSINILLFLIHPSVNFFDNLLISISQEIKSLFLSKQINSILIVGLFAKTYISKYNFDTEIECAVLSCNISIISVLWPIFINVYITVTIQIIAYQNIKRKWTKSIISWMATRLCIWPISCNV